LRALATALKEKVDPVTKVTEAYPSCLEVRATRIYTVRIIGGIGSTLFTLLFLCTGRMPALGLHACGFYTVYRIRYLLFTPLCTTLLSLEDYRMVNPKKIALLSSNSTVTSSSALIILAANPTEAMSYYFWTKELIQFYH